MEEQVTKLSLDDILLCSVTPVYAGFEHLTAEEALARADAGSTKVSGTADHLILSSPEAPAFCKSAEFVFGRDHRITGFEVVATRADDLQADEVLQHADRFDFNGGTYTGGEQVYFSARSKDKKMLIEFEADNHKMVLARVSYFY